MSEQNIQESEQRQINLQLEYVNYTVEEILENKLNQKKRKTNITSTRRAVANQVDNDGIYVSGLKESVGSIIKNKALEKFEDFSNLVIQQQTMTSLGMNSILDLTCSFNEGQSTIFSQEQWNELQARFPADEEKDPEVTKNLQSISTRYLSFLKQLSKAKNGLEKKLKSLYNWAKEQERKAGMNEEEEFFLYLISHIIKRQQNSTYLFDSTKDCSEWDYVVKLWSPLIEELFDNVSNLRTKWGDTVYKLAKEDGSADLKIDIRIILDKVIQTHNVEYDVCSGEFSKYNPGNLKYQSDRCKVMIEGKGIINQLVHHDVDIFTIPVLQICGPELHLLEVSLVAPGLYVGNSRCSFSLINTWENFKILPNLVESLLNLKNECMQIGGLLEDCLKTIEYKKGSTTSLKHQSGSSRVVNEKKKWTRGNWIVSRNQKYTKSTIPSPPF